MRLDKNIKTNSNELLFSSTDERLEMTISSESSAHLVHRLTDMYPRPIDATVRELMSNAIDATNRTSGGDKNVEISLPNEEDLTFIVTDYGEGMSIDTVREIYSQYGSSTKSSDLKQIGAYGLGAKAPLAYCSHFEVETTRDGVTTEFTVVREDTGNYTRILNSETTGKPSGTKVTIPVKKEDIIRFYEVSKEYGELTLETNVVIDGEVASPTINLIGTIPVPSLGDEFQLRVFAYKSPKEFIDAYINSNISYMSIGYFLSGWNYSKRHNPTFMVELIPGIVDFSSSRDEITSNYRFDELVELCNNEVRKITSSYITKVLDDDILSEKETLQIMANIAINSKRYLGETEETFRNEILSRTHGSGVSYRELITNVDSDEVLLTMKVSLDSAAYIPSRSLATGNNDSLYPYKTSGTIKEISKLIECEDLLKCSIESTIPYVMNEKEHYFVVDSNSDDLISINTRANTLGRNLGLRAFQITATSLDKKSLLSRASHLIEIDERKVLTKEEFTSLSKRKVSSSGPRTKAKRKPNVKKTIQFTAEKSTHLKSSLVKTSHNKTGKFLIEDLDSTKRNVLLVTRNTHEGWRIPNLKEMLTIETTYSDVDAYLIRPSNINSSNVGAIVDKFDAIYIHNHQSLKFRTETIRKTLTEASEELSSVRIHKTINDFEYVVQMMRKMRTLSVFINRLGEDAVSLGIEEDIIRAANLLNKNDKYNLAYEYNHDVNKNGNYKQIEKLTALEKSDGQFFSEALYLRGVDLSTPIGKELAKYLREKLSID